MLNLRQLGQLDLPGLRAATSMARMWKKSKAPDARAEIYGWFTERFDTPDLVDAETLLPDLA